MLRQNKSLVVKAVIFLLLLVMGMAFLLRSHNNEPPGYEQREPEPTPASIIGEEEPEYPPRREPIGSYIGVFECECPQINHDKLTQLAPPRRREDIVQVAAFHLVYGSILLLETDGTLWAWGNNHSGQLGDGTMIGRSAPVQVLDSVIYVSPDGFYAIREDNSLWGWGVKLDDDQADWPDIVPVAPRRLMDDVHAIFRDTNRDFVLRTDGSLWALNTDRRLQSAWAMRSVPSAETDAVHIMSSVVEMHHSQHHVMALLCNGSLWGIRGNETFHVMDEVANVFLPDAYEWAGNHGNIFVIQTDGSLWSVQPNLVSFQHVINHMFDDVATVNRFNGADFILLNDGTLWAMGRNTSGRLGDGSRNQRNEPVRIKNNVAYIHQAHGDATFAITTDGSLWAWGSGITGLAEIGIISPGQLSPLHILDNIKAIYPAWNVNLALDYEGNLWAFGGHMGAFGALPVHIKSSVARVYNRSGTYVIDTNNSLWRWENRPIDEGILFLQLLDSVSDFHVSGSETFAILSDGSIWGWGYNWDGSIGIGTFNHRSSPVNISYSFSYTTGGMPVSLGYATVEATTIIALDAPFIHMAGDSIFFVDSANQLWSWGMNWNNQLGHETMSTDEWVSIPPGFVLDGITYVLSDGSGTLALRTDGSLWTWGREHSALPQWFMGDIQALYSDFENYFALGTDGNLWQWERFASNPQVRLENVRSFYLVNRTYFAIKNDGSLWSWGHNPMGILGDGSPADAGMFMWGGWGENWEDINPVQILEDVSVFHTEGNSAFAIQTNGNLWAWGDNSHGQLGNGTRTSQFYPVFIMDGVESIATGGLTSFAVRVGGGLWAWGYNAQGQFGNGTNISSLRPMHIMDAPRLLRKEDGSVFMIDANDSLWVWGVGYESVPVQKLTHVADIFMDVNGDVYVIQTDGTLLVFEVNGEGQIFVMDNVAAFSINWGIYLAITTDGNVWGWGGNWSGILGDHGQWIAREELVLVFGN